MSPEVYNVFDITGFTIMTDILRKPREITLDGCEVIGRGASATMYRMDEETVVKIFDPAIGIERIERERQNAKAAFVSGLPTAIPFDTVHCSDGYGTVYELIDAVTLSRFMLDNPDKAPEYRASRSSTNTPKSSACSTVISIRRKGALLHDDLRDPLRPG